MNTTSQPPSWQDRYDDAIKVFDYILAASGEVLSSEHRTNIVGERVREVLGPDRVPFGTFMFHILEELGVSDPGSISPRDARSVVFALRIHVEFGYLRWGIMNLAPEAR